MPKIKPLPPQKVIKILEKAGFRILRQKGSHLIMINEKGTRIVVPVHLGKDIKPGLIRAIIKEAGLKREEFFKLLKEK
ncbi:type II toxin-antitoxin system HicA family toxin [Candidatus Bathyarchaeota archaeon]|nr:MAG: type II toxin-antitoxin system HicA family toxin [Candidatus Bathyarchaeota archaeon]HDD69762.1 addiction module toxin, HicA family [Candidatus Bathyarchaeota archaeon]